MSWRVGELASCLLRVGELASWRVASCELRVPPSLSIIIITMYIRDIERECVCTLADLRYHEKGRTSSSLD